MKRDESSLTNLTKLYILLMLRKKEMHGYEMMTYFKQQTDKTLSPGQLYPMLNAFRKKGYLGMKLEHHGKRRRKIYFLTGPGRDFCDQLLGTLRKLIDTE